MWRNSRLKRLANTAFKTESLYDKGYQTTNL